MLPEVDFIIHGSSTRKLNNYNNAGKDSIEKVVINYCSIAP
jgi:hypothetical protein